MPETHADIQKVGEMMKGIRFAMLTTVEQDGSLHSRPMATQDIEFDGDLWFFTKEHTAKVWEAERHREVSVTFADPEKSRYIAVAGKAELVHDRAKMEELWKAPYKIYFPQGLEDPEIALLKVKVDSAEYWDSAPTAVGRAFHFAKAMLTKDPKDMGDHGKVQVS